SIHVILRFFLSYLSLLRHVSQLSFFFFNDPATTEIYTLSLHDALPISAAVATLAAQGATWIHLVDLDRAHGTGDQRALLHQLLRSEEHTSELQSRSDLVCRLLLEKKKITITRI